MTGSAYKKYYHFESVGPRVFPAFLTAAVAGSIVLLAVILILLRRRSAAGP